MSLKVVYFNRSYQSDRNVLFVVPSIVYCLQEQYGGYKSLICDYRTMHLPVLLTYPCSTIRLHQDLMNKWAISLVISILLSLWLCLYLARI